MSECLIPINGPGVNGAISVTDTASEVKVGATALDQRYIVTIQPTDGHIYFGYSAGVTAANGTKIFKNQTYSFEATDQLPIYVIADTGLTVDVRITEVS